MRRLVVFVSIIALMACCSNPASQGPVNGHKEIKVNTSSVRLIQDEVNLVYSGTVEALQVIPLSFRNIGTVDKVFVDVGDKVRKGQVLATLDDSEMQNIYDAAEAQYKQAEDAYRRLKQVYDQGSLPEIKWVEMQTNLEQAKSSLDLARNNLEKCTMISPVDGIVGSRNIEPGQSSVTLTAAPIELVRIEQVFVKVSVPENEINKIGKGQEADVSVAALDGMAFTGRVTQISPVAERISRTYTIKIAVDNPSFELKPGMVCDVRLEPESGAQILIVPVKAVTQDSYGETYVFVVNSSDNTVKKRQVKTGRFLLSGIEILDGLQEGETVVSEGGSKLMDNSKIVLQ